MVTLASLPSVIRPWHTAATTIDFWADDKFSRSGGGKSANVVRFPSGPMKKGSLDTTATPFTKSNHEKSQGPATNARTIAD